MKPIIRWTIGAVQPDGFLSLVESVNSIKKLYDAEFVICHNNLSIDQLKFIQKLDVILIDQTLNLNDTPIGVAWKLYPPSIGDNQHQLFIDNDLIIQSKIKEIDNFFNSDSALLLQGQERNYGRFEKHVMPGFCINSGIFGIPPKLKLTSYMNFFGSIWTNNCFGQSATWDEQGFVTTALLNYPKFHIIPNTIIANCETELIDAPGLHFVGLNRREFHWPFRLYQNKGVKIY